MPLDRAMTDRSINQSIQKVLSLHRDVALASSVQIITVHKIQKSKQLLKQLLNKILKYVGSRHFGVRHTSSASADLRLRPQECVAPSGEWV